MSAVPALVGFARTLRAAGVGVNPQRVHAWVEALRHLDPTKTADVYWAGRVTLCASPDDVRVYDAAFTTYFGTSLSPQTKPLPMQRLISESGAADGDGSAPGRTATAMTASRREVLRHHDLSKLNSRDRAEVNRMLAAIGPTGLTRASRRHQPAKRGRLDPARTARDMLRRGGEPARLLHRAHKIVTRRVVMLVDVSGSMSPYADSLLRFAHAACRRRPSTEVFTLGTRLTRVTRELLHPIPDHALAAAGAAVPDWSGGTRLGEQVKAFLDRWGKRGIARGAVVVIASDGWERGDTTVLSEQMRRLRLLAHRVIWVSPHAYKSGFSPDVAGLRAVEPTLDVLMGGHSAAALERLARLLSEEVVDARRA